MEKLKSKNKNSPNGKKQIKFFFFRAMGRAVVVVGEQIEEEEEGSGFWGLEELRREWRDGVYKVKRGFQVPFLSL